MPSFGAKSRAALGTAHPDLQLLFNTVILYWDCSVIEGARDEAGQEAAFESGASTLHWPNGKHNVDGKKRTTAWSVDVVPYPIDWKNRDRFLAFGGFVLGIATMLKAEGKMKYAVRWGGDWDGNRNPKDEKLSDLPHFELVGVPNGE